MDESGRYVRNNRALMVAVVRKEPYYSEHAVVRFSTNKNGHEVEVLEIMGEDKGESEIGGVSVSPSRRVSHLKVEENLESVSKAE